VTIETTYWVVWNAAAVGDADVLQVGDAQVAVDVAQRLAPDVEMIQALDVRFDRSTGSIVGIEDLTPSRSPAPVVPTTL
jgi:hypothetical protein